MLQRLRRTRQLRESFGASIAVQFALIGSGILVARTLGPAGRGDLAVIVVLPAVSVQLVCLGLPSAVTYYVARDRAVARVIVSRVIPVAVGQTLVAAIVLYGLVERFLGDKTPGTHTAALWTIAAIPMFIAQYYALHLLQGLGSLRWFNAFRVATPLAFTLGLAIGLLFELDVFTCTLIWLASCSVVCVATVGVLAIRVPPGVTPPDATRAPALSEMVRFAAAGFLAQVSPVETFRIDTLVVASLFSSQVIGYYSVALSVSNAPRFVADAIVAVAYPQIASHRGRSGSAMAMRYLLAAALACGGTALALALLSPSLIPFLFGQEFEPAASLSAVLVIAAGLISIRRVGTDCLRALGRPAVTTWIEVVTLLMLAVGFVVLGPRGHGLGVALALVASAAAGLVLTLRALRMAGRRSVSV